VTGGAEVKKAIQVIAVFFLCLSASAGYAADAEQDWYTWYEQQNAEAASQAENEYEQYYEATSSDQSQGYYDETTAPDQYDDDYGGAASIGIIGGEGTNEPGWIWADTTSPDQTQQDTSVSGEQSSN
jgi:hypothetical protein